MRTPFRRSSGLPWLIRQVIKQAGSGQKGGSIMPMLGSSPQAAVERIRTDYRNAISRRDEAAESLRALNRPVPTEVEISQATRRLQLSKQNLIGVRDRQYRMLSGFRWALILRQSLSSLIHSPLDFIAGSLLLAVPAFAAGLFAGLIMGIRGPLILVPALTLFIISIVALGTVFRYFDNSRFAEDLPALSTWLSHRRQQIIGIRAQIVAEAKLLSSMKLVQKRNAELRSAIVEVDAIELRLKDQRLRLQITDWRSMRGIDFEQFLATTFRVLGYAVQTTKASSDQGVDLIVSSSSLRLAVQAKGYDGSVGNHAAMEANAGMKYYGCQTCCVITNSVFTSTAKELALRIGCRLIDGTMIPMLIDGKIYPAA